MDNPEQTAQDNAPLFTGGPTTQQLHEAIENSPEKLERARAKANVVPDPVKPLGNPKAKGVKKWTLTHRKYGSHTVYARDEAEAVALFCQRHRITDGLHPAAVVTPAK